jgi:hypothetical protein
MLSPCRLLIGERGQRRFRIHRRDQLIEAEHLSLSLKETGLEDPIKRAVPLHQLGRAFWPDSGSARQFVRRVPAERDEVRHLVWIDAISLLDLFGPNTGYFPAPRRVQDRCARRGELKRIPIAARHQCRAAGAFLQSNCGGEKVVRLVSWGFDVRKPKCGDKFGQDV